MQELWSIVLLLPVGALLAAVLLPASTTVAARRRWRRGITGLVGLQALLAGGLGIGLATGWLPPLTVTLWSWGQAGLLELSVLYDGVSCLMFAMVSFVGWVICRFSVRYLDGEPTQAHYYRRVGWTIGAVSLMVLAGNLLLFLLAWVMTSWGLHRLLLHYADRPAAQRAAWTKFTISRLGDAALVAATILIYRQFGTLDFTALFAALPTSADGANAGMQWAAGLLVLGAATKSAQVPFHTWLPQTLETPTPVSALMHAGIVNAGGFLVIRTSPLLALNAGALVVLAVGGGTTACFGAAVMLTQTSVKKSLAYSTVAQMGFMMLQCGLGAFSAAMLHIVAHSLYKAYAFLSSGSLLAQAAATQGAASPAGRFSGGRALFWAVSTVGFLAGLLIACGVDPTSKPGGFLLGGILALALTSWLEQVAATGDRVLLGRAVAVAGLLSGVYVASYLGVDRLIGASVPQRPLGGWEVGVSAVFFVAFLGLFLLPLKWAAGPPSRWLQALYVHTSNGFYLEPALRRLFGPLASS
jgi:NAD(P)H-quinone oxidoreductase subunit 5